MDWNDPNFGERDNYDTNVEYGPEYRRDDDELSESMKRLTKKPEPAAAPQPAAEIPAAPRCWHEKCDAEGYCENCGAKARVSLDVDTEGDAKDYFDLMRSYEAEMERTAQKEQRIAELEGLLKGIKLTPSSDPLVCYQCGPSKGGHPAVYHYCHAHMLSAQAAESKLAQQEPRLRNVEKALVSITKSQHLKGAQASAELALLELRGELPVVAAEHNGEKP